MALCGMSQAFSNRKVQLHPAPALPFEPLLLKAELHLKKVHLSHLSFGRFIDTETKNPDRQESGLPGPVSNPEIVSKAAVDLV